MCNFDKKTYLEVKNQLAELNQYILQPEYSSSASLVIDGELKAANKNYFIFVFNNINDSDLYNENILNIDELLSKIFNNMIHSISVSLDEWNIIKNDFNSKKKQYQYIEETEDDVKFLTNDKEEQNNIEKSFDDLVEYN